ncbi:hypothetical protein [Streptomyces sp. NPDC058434]|uniref:hypothetical protein n=1 Tax=Streptomyces sp. NPDC058434 TaxID=3346498 RepID=UPI0036514F18
MSKTSRTLALILGAAALAGSALVTAAPAQAATPAKQCKTTTKTFALPSKPDVKVSATICMQRTAISGGYRYYETWLSSISWDGTSSFIGGKRFNGLSVQSRAKHGKTVVKNCSYGTCEERSIASYINNAERGSKSFARGAAGYGVVFVKTKAPNWTGDATAFFDVADDGIPTKKWELTGTRAVY